MSFTESGVTFHASLVPIFGLSCARLLSHRIVTYVYRMGSTRLITKTKPRTKVQNNSSCTCVILFYYDSNPNHGAIEIKTTKNRKKINIVNAAMWLNYNLQRNSRKCWLMRRLMFNESISYE